MKKIILSLALVTGLTGLVNAQNNNDAKKHVRQEKMQNKTPDERAQMEANKAEKELGLNAEQKIKWQNAALERISENAPLREKMKGSTTPEEREKLRSQMKIGKDKFDTNINSFLTTDQKTKWDNAQKDRKNHRKGKMKGV